jgi:nucleoside-diphosphate-sugar epimerase
MIVLVTGATGLLGSHVVDLLLERGERVRALARPGEDVTRLLAQGVEVVWGDMGDRASLAAAVASVARVLHCAARTGPWGPEVEYAAANVRGLTDLIEESLKAGVRRIVHVSSITVHGNDVRGAAVETAPLRVEPNPYSRTKVAGERLIETLVRERGAPVVIVRPGWIYGPRDRASFARFAAMIERGKMVMIGGGDNVVPLIYARDVAHGVLLAGDAPETAHGRAYLLVNDERVTQRDYLGAIAKHLGVAPPTLRIPYRLAVGLGTAAEVAFHLAQRQQPPPLMRYGVQLLGGDNQFVIARARQELGFAPRVNLHEGVGRSIAWYKSAYQSHPHSDPSDSTEHHAANASAHSGAHVPSAPSAGEN